MKPLLSRFEAPGTILTGVGAFSEVGRSVAAIGKKCLVVTGGRAMQEQRLIDRATSLLDREGVAVVVYSGIEPEPTLEVADAVCAIFRGEGCDTVLGLGGGSVLDIAKVTAALASAPGRTQPYFDGREIPGRGAPVVAVPSTFGTGAEATGVAVLGDPGRRTKHGIRHPSMLPRVAIVDPEIGANAPRTVTAAAGLDALTQAIESYLSLAATELTHALSSKAIMLLAHGLPRSLRDGTDLQAREMCAVGSLMAGMAFYNSGLGIVHGLANPLGGRYRIRHGELCGILLPHALRFNRKAAGDCYGMVGSLLGDDPVAFCLGLLRMAGLPENLHHLGIDPSDGALISDVLASSSTKVNPRTVTKPLLVQFLAEVCGETSTSLASDLDPSSEPI